ncbi:glycosyltransferase involved in cell wall biosynthesis [Duganella sp. 1224]|uniref:glycosyltransferase n=1 Tax=Duganella sp. 1224 TaxID=2587052 RepID=UPI0015CA4319|nr:glycosyltransferase [Duganella sp. 1224]NYE59977.1 glycosyltransferase involved in cell wall biosynthesis [Duganella sp. 1224]
MIGIVIPAHNEERYLDACLRAARAAAADPALHGEAVRITVALDSCTDNSRAIVERHATESGPRCLIDHVSVDARNVGITRAAGARHMLHHGARWLAFTDADTEVAPNWLAEQLRLNVDVVCGTVAVHDWSPHRDNADLLRNHFHNSYTDADGHRHIHGANLGVAADAYLRAGGFAPLACSEDVALVTALERTGARFAWSAAPRVTTSARRDAKARGGFGDTLLRYVETARAASAAGM